MPPVISIHEYRLKPDVEAGLLAEAFRVASTQGLFDLPGLVGVRLLQGMKGARRARLAAMWIYESRDAWEALWGTPETPRSRDAYPRVWRVWEDELLEPLLDEEPDAITFTVYEEVWSSE